MSSPMSNTVDDATIRATLSAFEATMADVNAAMQTVDAIGASVQWSGEAANRYRTSLADWITGVRQVQDGLEMLRTAMTQHLSISSNAEDEASANAQWYA